VLSAVTIQVSFHLQLWNPQIDNDTAIFTAREGKWQGSPQPRLGHDPQGKVLGILGMGGIGRNLMKKAAVFGMRTQYYNRSKLSDELSCGANYVSFDELLATSDVLSLNLPLNVSPPHFRFDFLQSAEVAKHHSLKPAILSPLKSSQK
jgi:lactate dehydrogenase-like 2-hydroxyacid dehydrogenase